MNHIYNEIMAIDEVAKKDNPDSGVGVISFATEFNQSVTFSLIKNFSQKDVILHSQPKSQKCALFRLDDIDMVARMDKAFQVDAAIQLPDKTYICAKYDYERIVSLNPSLFAEGEFSAFYKGREAVFVLRKNNDTAIGYGFPFSPHPKNKSISRTLCFYAVINSEEDWHRLTRIYYPSDPNEVIPSLFMRCNGKVVWMMSLNSYDASVNQIIKHIKKRRKVENRLLSFAKKANAKARDHPWFRAVG